MLIQSVLTLGSALLSLKGKYDQHGENKKEMKELQSFIEDYDHQIPILRERFQEVGGNVMGNSALMNLEKDVMKATNMLEEWSRDQSFFQLFNSIERMKKLEKLHRTIMASMQNCLGVASLSMLLDLQASQATILESNAELKSLLITSIGSMHGTLPTKVRDEVVEASTSSFADLKFWKDVLAAVDNHNASVSLLEEKNIYEDPITTNLMIDPVVASDGNTYCRWTIIDNNLTTNPFNVDEDLTIVIDNLTFRRGLFENFPEQAQIFQQRRNQYRSHALALKTKELWGDAILALHYVLQWDKHDVECIEALEQVQRTLQEAKKKYLQPFMRLFNEPSNGGLVDSSMHEMLLGIPVGLHEAYELFPSLSSSTPEVRQTVAYNICHWCEKDVEFQSYIVEKGGILLLAALLPSSNQITQEHLVSILLEISQSSNKRQTIFGIVKLDFSDALEPIAKILKEGSTKVRKQAARIFFNLSMSPNRGSISENSMAMLALVTSLGDGTPQVQKLATKTLNNLFPDTLEPIAEILKEGSTEARKQAARILFSLSTSPDIRSDIGNSGAMCALLTSLGDGTLQVQQIVASTLNNLFHHNPNEMLAIEAGLVPILLRLIAEQPSTMLEEALALVVELLSFGFQSRTCHVIRIEAPANIWLDIIASESPVNRERAASILYNLCYNDQQYSQQARESQAHQRIRQSALPIRTRHNLLELLNLRVTNKNYPRRWEIPFPKMDWWSP